MRYTRTMTTYRNPVELLPEVVDRIVQGFDPTRIILFGSRARGNPRPDSDVDLLVVFDVIENKATMTASILACLAEMPVFKDVVVTTPDEIRRRGDIVGTVLRPALREGKTLYERPG